MWSNADPRALAQTMNIGSHKPPRVDLAIADVVKPRDVFSATSQ